MDFHIENTHHVPRKMDFGKKHFETHPYEILGQEGLKSFQREKWVIYNKLRLRMASDFSIEILDTEREGAIP